MERPPSSGLRLLNTLIPVDQDYGTPTLQWTKIMEHPPSSGPRLWNALPPVDKDYGTPSLLWTKIMECLPSCGPRSWNVPSLPSGVVQDDEIPSLEWTRLLMTSLEWTKIMECPL